MVKKTLPKVGFMPSFENLGDTFPLVEIAERYNNLGGEVVFFGYKGSYKCLVDKLYFKIVELENKIPDHLVKKTENLLYEHHYKNRPKELSFKTLFSGERKEIFRNKIDQEIRAFKKEKIHGLVSAYNFTNLISARVASIPLITVVSGVAISDFFKSNLGTFPDNYENFFTRLIPSFVKNRFSNWYIYKARWGVKGYNNFAENYDCPTVNRFLDLICGDHTLVADDLKFLNIEPSKHFPAENFIGPILPDSSLTYDKNHNDHKIKEHINKPGRSILLTFASSGTRKTFLDVCEALDGSGFNVVALYSNILSRDELPDVSDNIIFRSFVPSIRELNELVDLAVIHGGRGTVYNAAYAGKPVVGIPMHSEQQHNLDNLIRHGCGIRISRKFFSCDRFLRAVDSVFNDYDLFFKRAQRLKLFLPEANGALNAAVRIKEIVEYESKILKDKK